MLKPARESKGNKPAKLHGQPSKPRHGLCEVHRLELVCRACTPELTLAGAALGGTKTQARAKASQENGKRGGRPKACPKCQAKMVRVDASPAWFCKACGHSAPFVKRNRYVFDPFRNLAG